MKKVLFALFSLLSVAGFSQNYMIEGRVAGKEYNGAKVYLTDIVGRKNMDSTTVAGGKFRLNGKVQDPKMVTLSAKKGEASASLTLVLEAGKIYADLITDSLSGTKLNTQLHVYQMSLGTAEFEKQLEGYYEEYEQAKDEEAKKKAADNYNRVMGELDARKVKSAEVLFANNRDNILGGYAMGIIASADGTTLQMLEQRLATASDEVRNYPPVAKALERFRALEATSVGKHYTDFECDDFATGRKTHLGELIDGRLALVDFWASWCSPCRNEIKNNLLRISETYKGKGLLVVGVDVWDKPEKHKSAVEQLGIQYPQVIDNTKVSTSIYGIEGIPHIMLIGPDGTILARDLRGEEIEKAIIEALGK